MSSVFFFYCFLIFCLPLDILFVDRSTLACIFTLILPYVSVLLSVFLIKCNHLQINLHDSQTMTVTTIEWIPFHGCIYLYIFCFYFQFKKVFKDFTSLVQQTLTFVMHLQDLSVSQEKNSIKISDVEDVQSSVSPLSSLPVYSIALMTENTALDLEPKPPNTPSSKFSMINLLCGVRKRRWLWVA